MPIYEYQCDKCGHHLEALQKISDKPLRECPECGKHSLKRLVSAPMFRLAGSGWYETDFKSDKENRRNLAGKDEAPAAETTAKDKDKDSGTGAAPADKKPEPKPAESETGPKKTMVPKPALRSSPKTGARQASQSKSRPASKKSSAGKAARRR